MMRELEIGFLPVCDRSGITVGVVTDRDIVTRACALDEDLHTTPVRRIMTSAVLACRPDEPISRAESRMRRHRVTRLVVTDPLRRALGVVSLSDLAQYERPSAIGRTLRGVAQRKYAPERP